MPASARRQGRFRQPKADGHVELPSRGVDLGDGLHTDGIGESAPVAIRRCPGATRADKAHARRRNSMGSGWFLGES